MQSPAPIPVVAGIFFRLQSTPEVLLFQRAHSDVGGGLWEFPGGKVEKGESDVQALVRELEEELRIRTRVLDFLGRSEVKSPSGRVYELRIYFVEGDVSQIQLTEHLGMKWVTESTLVLSEVAEGDRPLMADCFARIKRA